MNIYSSGAIYLFGAVGQDFDGGEFFTATMVREALTSHGARPVTVYINSGGGYAAEGLAVHNALKSHPGSVTVVVDGIAASAASLIAMAGETIIMRRGSTMMLHDPSCGSHGSAADHERTFKALDTQAREMASIYAARSKNSVAHIRKLMVAETWFSGGDAVAEGLADRVEEVASRTIARYGYATAYHHPPADILNQSAKANARLLMREAVAFTNFSRGLGPKPRRSSGSENRSAAGSGLPGIDGGKV